MQKVIRLWSRTVNRGNYFVVLYRIHQINILLRTLNLLFIHIDVFVASIGCRYQQQWTCWSNRCISELCWIIQT